MADGEIRIRAIFDGKEAEEGINDLGKMLKSLSGISPIFGKLGAMVSKFGGSFGALSTIIGSTAAKATAGITLIVVAYGKLYEASKKNFVENLQKYGEVFVKIGSAVANVAGQILNALFTLGNAPTSIEAIITSFANFTSRMQEVRAITSSTNSEFEQMYDLARKLGRDTIFSSLEVADALKALGMSGMNVVDSMNALPSVLRLAQISGMELGDTASVVADNLTALGMASTDTGDMVDMMAATITGSNTNLEQMKDAFSYAAQIAGTLGINFEDLALATGILANNGIKASKAGTSLRTFMTNLTAPTEKAAAVMAQYGVSLQETADGSVDLDATMINLRDSLGNLPLKEQAVAAKALFGKIGLAGGLSIINASNEAYNRLKGEISGSTERMTYWKQSCEDAGLSQEETAKKLDTLQAVFEESKDMADGLNISSTSLTKSISLLGDDGKVTSDNIESLFESFVKLGNASEPQLSAMEKYGVALTKNKDGSLDYDKSLNSIVTSLRGKTDAEKKAMLTQMGLADSFKELNELSNITPKRYDEITSSIEKTQSAAEKAEKIINESLTFSAEQMASTLDDLGIVLMSKVAPAMANFCDWISKTAGLMAQGKLGEAFTEFKKGLEDAYNSVKSMDLSGAIGQSINGVVTFLSGGGLSSILNLGTEIIQQICKGIIQNKDGIAKAIDLAIKDIATFIKANAGSIGEAGKVILEAIKNGIENNTGLIHDALESVVRAMDSWVAGSAEIKSLAGDFADIFIDSFIQNTWDRTAGKASEWWKALWSGLSSGGGGEVPSSMQDRFSEGINGMLDKEEPSFIEKIKSWFSGESFADETTGNEKPLKGGNTKDKTTTNLSDTLTGLNTKELEAFKTELAALQATAQSVSTSLATSFTGIQDSIRNSMTGSANIIRNQFVNMSNIVRNQSLNSANIVRNQFVNMSNIVRNQATNMTNVFRTQFLSMANVCRSQMLNASNIVRNQMVSMSNVIRNQAQNARNSFTTQFISMKNVARVQAQEARNNVTSAMMSMASVVRTQSSNARNSFTSAMISIKNVARVQSQEAGRYMATGLAAGIRSGTASAVAAARSMVNQVNAVVKSTAKIASPSKVTTEYGEFYGEGLGVGIKKSMPNVYKVAMSNIKGLNNQIQSSVNAEINKVSVNAKASSNSNIVNNNNNELKMSSKDIERIGNEMSKRPVKVETKIGEKTIVTAIAKPIKEYIDSMETKNKRLKGV